MIKIVEQAHLNKVKSRDIFNSLKISGFINYIQAHLL